MKNVTRILILVLLASLAVGLAACGGDSEPAAVRQGDATEALQPEPATDTPMPTDTPVPTDTPSSEPEEEAAQLNLDMIGTPSDLSSYRADMSISVSGTQDGEPVEGIMSFVIEYTSDPPAQHFIISAEGFEEAAGMGDIEMYQVDDTTYLQLGDQWLSVPADEEMLSEAGFIQPQDILADTCGWKKKGDTEYNGIRVHHWVTTREDMEACMTAEELAGIGQIKSASGELYTAIEGDYLVHMSIVFEGEDIEAAMGTGDQVLDEGQMQFTFDVRDVNEPLTIELPPEALSASSLPDDIPFPEDAQDVANAFGMITFSSPSTVAGVADFYKAEMPRNGWTQVSTSEVSGMMMMEYNKDGRTASLMITTDEDTGLTSVLLALQEE